MLKKIFAFVFALLLLFAFGGCKKDEKAGTVLPSSGEVVFSSEAPESIFEPAPESSSAPSEVSSEAASQSSVSSSSTKRTMFDIAREHGLTDSDIESMNKELGGIYALDYSGFRAFYADRNTGIAAEAALKNNGKSEKGFLVVRVSSSGERTTDYLYLAADSPKELSEAYEERASEGGGMAKWLVHMNPEKLTKFSFSGGGVSVDSDDKNILPSVAVELANYPFAKEFVSETSGFSELSGKEFSFRLDFTSGTYYLCQGTADVFTIYTSDLDKTITYKNGYKVSENLCKRMAEIEDNLKNGEFEKNVITG